MSPLIFNPSNDGFWGDTTSTLDWCETNYEVGLLYYMSFRHFNNTFIKLYVLKLFSKVSGNVIKGEDGLCLLLYSIV